MYFLNRSRKLIIFTKNILTFVETPQAASTDQAILHFYKRKKQKYKRKEKESTSLTGLGRGTGSSA